MVYAPWTEAQVEALKRWQNSGRVHPFTGELRDEHGFRLPLIPTREGWVEYVGGPIVQTWCHDFMLRGFSSPLFRVLEDK
jgi:hypothetical protein